MKAVNIWKCVAWRWCWLMLVALLGPATCARSAVEEHFDVLQIGAHTYKNVTVTTKAKNYIFILHSAGMTNIRVQDLTPELREQLGYGQKSAADSKQPLAWLKNTTSALEKQEGPRLGQVEQRVRDWEEEYPEWFSWKGRWPWALLGTCFLIHLSFSYCFRAVCLKVGHPPGILVWVPGLQSWPLLRAAGMSGGWFVALFFPLLNLLTYIVWSVRIVKAREKSGLVTLLMLLPPLNLLALLYLAFSGAPEPKEERRVELMTLDTA